MCCQPFEDEEMEERDSCVPCQTLGGSSCDLGIRGQGPITLGMSIKGVTS